MPVMRCCGQAIGAPHDGHRRNNIRLYLVEMHKAQADEILNRPLPRTMPIPRSEH